MATTGKSSVIVELYDLTITERKDDRFGRVVTTKSLAEDDLITKAVAQRTDLSATTLKASIDILKNIAIEQIANGASVSFGLGYFSLNVNGVFIGDNAKWDSSQHNLSVRVTANAQLKEAVAASSVDVRGMAESGLVINSVTDITSGEVNGKLTPGGGINITGSKIKIAGSDATVGVKLTNQTTGTVVSIPMTALLVNDPSKISCIVPASVEAGDYKLGITTQFSTSATLLKEPRSYTFDYVLTV